MLRTATNADADAIVALNRAVFDEEAELGARLLLDHPGIAPERFTVVTDGDRIVSSLCLMPQELRMGGVALPAGQIEFVATDPAYRRRGLVRAQFAVAHRWSTDRGDLLQIVDGIPYFYRRLGYEYAIAMPPLHLPAWREAPPMPAGYEIREATAADVPDLSRVLDRAQAGVDLVQLRSDAWWAVLLAERYHPLLVATEGGVVRGFGQLGSEGGPDDDLVVLRDLAVDTAEAGRALLAHAGAGVDAHLLRVRQRPGTIAAALLRDLTVPAPEPPYAIYVRVPDPVAVLERLRPVLSARLAASPFAADRGELVLSLYTSAVAISYADGEVTRFRPAAVVEDPGEESEDEVGVPPDLVATLLLGRYGAAGLAERHDDVRLGRRAALMEVLFPDLSVDLR